MMRFRAGCIAILALTATVALVACSEDDQPVSSRVQQPVPELGSRFVSVATSDGLIAAGGLSSQGSEFAPSRAAAIWTEPSGTWTALPDTPEGVLITLGTSLGGEAYLVGLRCEGPIPSEALDEQCDKGELLKLNQSGDGWDTTEVRSGSESGSLSTGFVGVVGDRLLIQTAGSMTSAFVTFDPSTSEWGTVPLPAPSDSNLLGDLCSTEGRIFAVSASSDLVEDAKPVAAYKMYVLTDGLTWSEPVSIDLGPVVVDNSHRLCGRGQFVIPNGSTAAVLSERDGTIEVVQVPLDAPIGGPDGTAGALGIIGQEFVAPPSPDSPSELVRTGVEVTSDQSILSALESGNEAWVVLARTGQPIPMVEKVRYPA